MDSWTSMVDAKIKKVILNDIQTVYILHEMYALLGTRYKSKLPGLNVNVLSDRVQINIRHHPEHFAVTLKLDGRRIMLYGRVCRQRKQRAMLQLYTVTTRRHVRLIGMSPCKDTCKSFLLDAEEIKGHFFVFNVFFIGKRILFLYSVPQQLGALRILLDEFPFLQSFVHVKDFYACTQETCWYVLKNTYKQFVNDGLIFTHTDSNQSIKWKKKEQLTVDFLLSGDKLYIDDVFIDRVCAPHNAKSFPSLKSLDNTIVECRPHQKNAHSSIQWVLVKPRPDKSQSNSTAVFKSNVHLYLNFVDIPQIFSAAETPQNDDTYWKQTAQPLIDRKDGLLLMKNFHNEVKSHVYELLFEQQSSLCTGHVHVEVAFGRGGDARKLVQHLDPSNSRVLALDKDTTALIEARSRWVSLNTNIKLETRTCDMNSTYVQNKMIEELSTEPITTICSHFACHYFMDGFIKLCNDVLKPKGRAAVTLFDKERVQALLKQYNGSVSFRAKGKEVIRLTEATENSVYVYLESIGNEHEETLYSIRDVIASNKRFTLLNFFYFDDVLGTREKYSRDDPLWGFTRLYVGCIFEKRPVTDDTEDDVEDDCSISPPSSPDFQPSSSPDESEMSDFVLSPEGEDDASASDCE